ncbi:MAG: BamA/TamA family outer membrane protein [Acidobacteriota bacterium]
MALVVALAAAAGASELSIEGASDPEDVAAIAAPLRDDPTSAPRVLRLLIATERYTSATVDVSGPTVRVAVKESPIVARIRVTAAPFDAGELGVGARTLPVKVGDHATERAMTGLVGYVTDRLAEAGFDDPRVDIVCRPAGNGREDVEVGIDPGTPTVVSGIDVRGEIPEQRDAIVAALDRRGVRVGARLDRSRCREVARDWRDGRIRDGGIGVRASFSEEEDGGGTRALFDLASGPRLVVSVDGVLLNEKKRQAVLVDAPGNVEGAASHVGMAVARDLETRGYFDAKVRATAGAGRIEVVTEKGERLHIAGVDAELPPGSESLAAELKTQRSGYHMSSGYTLGRLSRDDLAADRDWLERRLRYDGYLDATVGSAVVTRRGKRAFVRFPVKAGSRTVVTKLDLDAVAAWARQDIAIEAGGPWSAGRLIDAREAIREQYTTRGYLRASVRADVALDGSDGRRVTLAVDAGTLSTIGLVIVRGARHLPPSLIRRLSGARSGERLGRLTEESVENRLRRVNAIAGLAVHGAAPPAQRDPLWVDVRESPRFRFRYAVGFNTDEGLRGTVGFSDVSLFSSARSLSFLARGGRLDHRAEVSYRDPIGLGGDRGLAFTLFAGRERRSGFSFAKKGALLDVELFTRESGHRRTELLLRFLRKEVRLYDVDISPEQIPRGQRATSILESSLTFMLDRRDDPISPHRGWRARASVSVARPDLGAEAGYQKGEEEAFVYLPLRPRLREGPVLALGQRMGLGAPWGRDEIPITERFFLGGYQSMRAFDRDGVGPRDRISGEPIGGEAFHFATAELRVPVWGKLGSVLFFERGNVFENLSDLGGTAVQDVGVGLRYQSAAGPIRVEYAVQIGAEPRESRVFLSLGEAF